MIEDALAGKIDLIITKSISRSARIVQRVHSDLGEGIRAEMLGCFFDGNNAGDMIRLFWIKCWFHIIVDCYVREIRTYRRNKCA